MSHKQQLHYIYVYLNVTTEDGIIRRNIYILSGVVVYFSGTLPSKSPILTSLVCPSFRPTPL